MGPGEPEVWQGEARIAVLENVDHGGCPVNRLEFCNLGTS